MHELGIVFYIIRDVKQAALENHVDHVSAVVMDIGEVSTVVPEYLIDCWQWAVGKEPMLTGCELKINLIPAVTRCEDCGKEYDRQLVHARCSAHIKTAAFRKPHVKKQKVRRLPGKKLHSLALCICAENRKTFAFQEFRKRLYYSVIVFNKQYFASDTQFRFITPEAPYPIIGEDALGRLGNADRRPCHQRRAYMAFPVLHCLGQCRRRRRYAQGNAHGGSPDVTGPDCRLGIVGNSGIKEGIS